MATQQEIQRLLDYHEVSDLKSLIGRRRMLNFCNMTMIYLFHIVQSAGILTTTIATSYGATQIVWIGVGLNFIASLLSVFEKTNTTISAQFLADIKAIKEGTFVDEGIVVDPLENKSSQTQSAPSAA